MNCSCGCHDPLYYSSSSYSTLSGWTCSSCCAPTKSDGLTEENVGWLVQQITVIQKPEFNSVRYDVQLLDGEILSVGLSQEMLPPAGTENVVLRRMLAGELKKRWAKGMPAWAAERLAQGDPYANMLVGYNNSGYTVQQSSGASWSVPANFGESVDGQRVTKDLQTLLPGLKVAVTCPVTGGGMSCPAEWPVMKMVIHLNDEHRWSRVQVADWLDTLDIDLSFPLEAPPPLPKADPDKLLLICAPSWTSADYEARRRRRGQEGQRWRFISTRDCTTSRLRGFYDVQYVTLEPLSDEAESLLKSAGCVEVGEEPQKSMADYVAKIAEMQEAYLTQPLKLFTQAPEVSAAGYATACGPNCGVCAANNAIANEANTPPAPENKAVAALQAKKDAADKQSHLKVNPTKKHPFKKK